MGDKMRAMKDDYGVLPYPKFTEEKEMGYTHLDGTFSAMMVPITQPSENWERTGLITKALQRARYEMVTPAMYDSLSRQSSRATTTHPYLDLVLAGRRYSLIRSMKTTSRLSPVRAMRSLIGQRIKISLLIMPKTRERGRMVKRMIMVRRVAG